LSKKIGVVGAGLMGAEIALVFALAGHDVLLNDRDQTSLDRATARLRILMEKGVGRGFYKADEMEPTLARIRPITELGAFTDREFVTEAVFEARDVKGIGAEGAGRDMLRGYPDRLEYVDDSDLDACSGIAGRAQTQFHRDPLFLAGLAHEARRGDPRLRYGETTIETAMSAMMDIGKTPIRVKDVAGFAVNRMLHAFMIEAVKLVEEGVATPEDLDTACRLGLGHPIGPFALMDAVTSSLCVQAQEIMQEAYGERFRPPALLKQRIRAGYGGGKGKPGWFNTGE